MKAEYDAFVARMRAHTKLTARVYEAVRTTTSGTAVRDNYVVAAPAIPSDLGDSRLTAPQRFESRRFMSYDVRVVATTVAGLLDLAEAVVQQMVGHVLIVEGRDCDPISMATDAVEEGGARYDRATQLHYLDMSLEFYSREKE